MKFNRFTRKLLKRRRRSYFFSPLRRLYQKLRWKYDAACSSEAVLKRRIAELELQIIKQPRPVEGDHWLMVIEQEQNKVYHFKGEYAEMLAKRAFMNNTGPKRVVIIAKVLEWCGDYREAGKFVRGMEIRKKGICLPCEQPPNLIDYGGHGQT